MNERPVRLRARAIVAASLAATSRDPEIAKLLLIVSEELEEEACKLEGGTIGNFD